MSGQKSYSTTWYECGHGAGEIAGRMPLQGVGRAGLAFWAEVVCECDKGSGTEEAIASAAQIIDKDGGLVPDNRSEPWVVSYFENLMRERALWRESEAGKRWHERANEIIAKMARIPVE